MGSDILLRRTYPPVNPLRGCTNMILPGKIVSSIPERDAFESNLIEQNSRPRS